MKVYEHTKQITAEQALVLQQIDESVEETPVEIGRALRYSPPRLAVLLGSLRDHGLVRLTNASGYVYVTLSNKGKRLVRTMWPDVSIMHGHRGSLTF